MKPDEPDDSPAETPPESSGPAEPAATPDDGKTETEDESANQPGHGGADGNGDGDDEITAPSIGPNTVIEHEPPEERLDLDKISDEDAMGNDKRRHVVGKRYSASPARQVVTYALFVVVAAALVIGGKALATKLDEPDKPVKDEAPWTGNNVPVQRLDFPKYGEPAS